MSYDTFIASVKAALEETTEAPAPGLHAYPEPREDSLLTAARGRFDGAYLLRRERGPEPFPTTSTNPRHWKGVLALEIATELKRSLEEADAKTAERGRLAMDSLIYTPRVEAGAIYAWDEPVITRQLKDKRIVWTVRLSIRWSEP